MQYLFLEELIFQQFYGGQGANFCPPPYAELNVSESDMVSFTEICKLLAREGGGGKVFEYPVSTKFII